jgi:hypothetical protein
VRESSVFNMIVPAYTMMSACDIVFFYSRPAVSTRR